MRAQLLGHHEPNTPEWDELRSHGIGGSEIAAVVGLSPWESRFSLWHRKRGALGKQRLNDGMHWGTLLEPIVCDVYAKAHPEFWVMGGGTYRHPDRPWQLGNPDRLLYPTTHVTAKSDPLALFEAKTAHQYDAHEWGHGPEDIPPYYRCQVLWYLDVLELPVAHLAVLIGGSDYREYEISYSADEAEWLRAKGEEFWQSVLDDDAPDIDGSTATYEAIRELHPDIDGETVAIDPDLHEWFQSSKGVLAAADGNHRAAKSALLQAMGTAQYAEVDGERVYRRQQARGGAIALYSIPPFRAQPANLKEPA